MTASTETPPQPARRPGSAPARAWVGAVAAAAFLAGVVTADFLAPRKYVLIQYYGLAPLIAATTLDPRSTAGVGVVAILAAVSAGQWDDSHLGGADVLLRVGTVVACTLIAVVLAAVRGTREHRVAEVTEVAEVAQQAIVRTSPIALPDLDIATIYRSATVGAKVGGDLYEGVSSPFGSRLIIGDACGKGLSAVQLAAVVLGAFRHAALSEPDLGRLVTELDSTVVAFSSDEDFVTALIIEVTEVDVRIVSCGHPAPLVGPPRYVRPIDLNLSLPLGLGGPRPVTTRRWPTRQLLVAYTDGLVEARDERGQMLSIESLAASLKTSKPEEAVADFVGAVGRHVSGELKDDLTILAITRVGQ